MFERSGRQLRNLVDDGIIQLLTIWIKGTVKGLTKVAEARPVHARAVRTHFLGRLDPAQVASLSAMLGDVVADQ